MVSASRWKSTSSVESCRASCGFASPTTTSIDTAARCSTNAVSSTNSTSASGWSVTLHSARQSYLVFVLFHDLLLRSYLYHCVWSVITAHNLTPQKRDDNYSPHALTTISCLRNNIQLITGISLSLLLNLWVSVMHTLKRSSITVSRVSATF